MFEVGKLSSFFTKLLKNNMGASWGVSDTPHDAPMLFFSKNKNYLSNQMHTTTPPTPHHITHPPTPHNTTNHHQPHPPHHPPHQNPPNHPPTHTTSHHPAPHTYPPQEPSNHPPRRKSGALMPDIS